MAEFSPNVNRSLALLYFVMFSVWGNFLAGVVSEDDVKCLQGLQSSLKDPDGKLSSWNFANSSMGFVCNFVGVSCWNSRENRVIGLALSNMNLAGQVPDALHFCENLQTLDLSGNSLSGPIPPQICDWFPFLVTLDLSKNDFTGSIPEDIAKCAYLNNLVLDNNKLSGNIPDQLASLNRLKKFSAANNDLSGRVPSFVAAGVELNFDGNGGLCGGQSKKCGGLSKKNLAIIIAAGVLGAALGFGVGFWAIFS